MTKSPAFDHYLGYGPDGTRLTSQQKLLINVLIVALLTWYGALAVASYSAYHQVHPCVKSAAWVSALCNSKPVVLDPFVENVINGLGTAFTAALGLLLGINLAWANAQRQGDTSVSKPVQRQYLKAAWIGAGLFVLSLALMLIVRFFFSLQGLAPYWPTTLGNLIQTTMLIVVAAVGGATALSVTTVPEVIPDNADKTIYAVLDEEKIKVDAINTNEGNQTEGSTLPESVNSPSMPLDAPAGILTDLNATSVPGNVSMPTG